MDSQNVNDDADDGCPDTVALLKSGIIVKQISMIVTAACAIAGVAVTPEKQTQIVAIVGGVVTIGLSVWTIHNRIKKPCPPVSGIVQAKALPDAPAAAPAGGA